MWLLLYEGWKFVQEDFFTKFCRLPQLYIIGCERKSKQVYAKSCAIPNNRDIIRATRVRSRRSDCACLRVSMRHLWAQI